MGKNGTFSPTTFTFMGLPDSFLRSIFPCVLGKMYTWLCFCLWIVLLINYQRRWLHGDGDQYKIDQLFCSGNYTTTLDSGQSILWPHITFQFNAVHSAVRESRIYQINLIRLSSSTTVAGGIIAFISQLVYRYNLIPSPQNRCKTSQYCLDIFST